MIPGPGPYVRALVICGKVDERPDGSLDIRGALTRLLLPSDAKSVRMDFALFVAIERNGDHGSHTFRLRFIDPEGETITVSDAMNLPPADMGDSLLIPSELPLRLPTWRPGRYRLLLEMDGRVAAFAPMDLEAVDQSALGLPRRRQLD